MTIRCGELRQGLVTNLVRQAAAEKTSATLRLTNANNHNYLFFRDGEVKIYAPARASRRLGEILLARGQVTQQELESALARQEAGAEDGRHRPLGEVLTDQGTVPAEVVRELARYQAVEDLHDVLTWNRGEFEWMDDASTRADLEDRLRPLPAFECTQFLAAAERRAAEWRRILKRVYSVDEIFVARQDRDRPELDPPQVLVMSALDGSRTIRQVAEATSLSLFDCAGLLCDLIDWQLVDLANAVSGLDAARECVERGETENAVVLLRALLERPGEYNQSTVVAAAELLRRCDAHDDTAEALVLAARICTDRGQRLELAREACGTAPRSIHALDYLHGLLATQGKACQAELDGIARRLVDALMREERYAQALEILDPLIDDGTDDPKLANRRIKALHGVGRSDEAVTALFEQVATLEKTNDTESLQRTYAQILHIDPSRTEAAQALRRLRARGPKRWLLTALARLRRRT